MATIQAAYDSLPDGTQGGGTIILLPGLYDVGTGFNGTGLNKHAVITSVSGAKPMLSAVARGGDIPLSYPVITTTQNAATLFQLGYTGGTNQGGWVFQGLSFDMSDSDTTVGIDGRDVNYSHVENCAFEGGTDFAVERYAVRTRVVNGSDASWWRVLNNWCHFVGMFRGGDGGADNGNQHLIGWNVIFPGANNFGIYFDHADRCVTAFNNIEGGSAAAIKLVSSDRCLLIGDAGEGAFTSFVDIDSASNASYVLPIGSNSAVAAIKDLATSNPNKYPAFKDVSVTNQTASYVLAYTDMGTTLRMNVAGANNLTVPLEATVTFPQGAWIQINQRGAGQTTIVPATGAVNVRSSVGLKLRAQYSVARLEYMGGDEWQASGDLTP